MRVIFCVLLLSMSSWASFSAESTAVSLEALRALNPGKACWIGALTHTDESMNFRLSIKREKTEIPYIRLLFIDLSRKKLAYIPMELEEENLKFRGAFIAEHARKKGLLKVIFSVYLRLSKHLGLVPTTAIMNKPLIAMVLPQFGFSPKTKGVALFMDRAARGDEVVLFGPKIFGTSYMSKQNMMFGSGVPKDPRELRVYTAYTQTNPAMMEEAVVRALENWALVFE